MRVEDRSIYDVGGPRRAESASRRVYDALCDEALDYYLSGDAQRRHLRSHMIRRYGEEHDPRRATSTATDTTVDFAIAETDAGRIIRESRIELITVPMVRSIVDAVAVLYSADDLERHYTLDGEMDTETAETLAWYHDRAGLSVRLQQTDALSHLLGASLLLVRYCDARQQLAYDVVYPHAVHTMTHPDWPLDHRMAMAIAYRETRPDASGQTHWCAYVRPTVPGDPDDAPGRDYPRGRLVRYRADSPWPIPTGDAVVDDGDNPIVVGGGMARGRMLWHPLVWHWSSPPVESLYPHPQSDLVAANREVDLAMSWLQYLASVQSHGQAVKRGGGAVAPPRGPATIVEIDDPSGGCDYVSPGADIAGLLQVVHRQMQTQALLRHLSPDMYSLQRPSIQTGPAKRIEQHALIEARWRRTLLADRWEQERFELERLLHNAHGGQTGRRAIPDDTVQTVRWGELRVPVDRGAQVQRLRSEMDAGFITRVDAIMETQGLDRDAAERHIDEVDAAAAPDEGETAELSAEEMHRTEVTARGFETFVKAKAPDVARPLAVDMLDRLGLPTDAAQRADYEWYTTPVEEIPPGADEG